MSKAVAKKGGGEGEESIVSVLFDNAMEKLPSYRPILEKIKPIAVALADIADNIFPYIVKAWNAVWIFWDILQPYNPQQFFPLLLGLSMCFFGGAYFTLIASVEALRLTVWKRIHKSVGVLIHNYKLAATANEKDNQVDEDQNGVADVKEITKKELLTRKLYVLGKSIDPNQTTEAISAVWSGFLTVLATVRIKFAQTITLGCGVGEMARRASSYKVEQFLRKALPEDLEKWSPQLVQYGYNCLGMVIAFFLQTVVGAFHSSLRGGKLATVAGLQLAKNRGWVNKEFKLESKTANLIAMLIAATGFLWQVYHGFSVPFPLNILFLPITILENMLKFCLTVGMGSTYQ